MKTSVIICTHNPREDYFHRTLASLQAQTLPNEQWELLVIDNASEQPLAQVLDLSWHADARCLREAQVGLTLARLRGIREATGELLVFIDDDNVLTSDYLERALAINAKYPFLGAFGAGVLQPEFESAPTRKTSAILPLLALRSVASVVWSNNPRDSATIPWGAGMCVARAVANRFLQLVEALGTVGILGRRGKDLFCGEDDVFSWAAAQLGLGFGVFPDLKITHLIPTRRLQPEYLLRLVRDHSFSHGVLRYLLNGVPPKSTDVLRRIRMALHGIRRGRFSMRCHEETARGEAAAARFIRENQLVPQQFSSQSVPNESSLSAN